MKVTVKDFLNVRVGAPSVNAPSYQYLAPGSEIEVDGNFYQGDRFDDSNIWLKDLAGNYYWRGGVTGFTNPIVNVPPSTSTELVLPSQVKLLNAMPAKNGNEINVAILDSGIDLGHPALSNAVLEKVDFLTEQEDRKNNTNPHGSLVAGIIVNNDAILQGLAVKSKLRDYRVIQNNGFVDSQALFNALQYMVDKKVKVDIVNMSMNLGSDLIPFIQPMVNVLASRGCIFVASGGTATIPNNITALEKTIFVGVFNKSDNPKTKKEYNASFLNTPIKSTGIYSIKPYSEFSGASAYAAMISGLIARFLSSTDIKNEERLDKVKNFLALNSFPEKNETTFISYKPLKA